MHLFGALCLFVTLSTACGLRCYTCTATQPRSCIDTKSCPVIFNRCYSLKFDGKLLSCGGAMACCEGDLCNSATLTRPSVVLLLVSSAAIALLNSHS
uniref:UPAR/Ly6 domain-containing protein n=1 Tax=Scophthalmus maximus TaxID=52904 RepID=A0A8D3D6Z2_SCOMX